MCWSSIKRSHLPHDHARWLFLPIGRQRSYARKTNESIVSRSTSKLPTHRVIASTWHANRQRIIVLRISVVNISFPQIHFFLTGQTQKIEIIQSRVAIFFSILPRNIEIRSESRKIWYTFDFWPPVLSQRQLKQISFYEIDVLRKTWKNTALIINSSTHFTLSQKWACPRNRCK